MKNRLVIVGLVAALTGALSVLFFSSFKPQDGAPQYVSLIAYTRAVGAEPKIIIVYENNSTEEITLDKKTVTQKVQIENAIKIHETINMLSHKGYRMLSAATYPDYVSYIFERRNQ
jgi:hypothetical protein